MCAGEGGMAEVMYVQVVAREAIHRSDEKNLSGMRSIECEVVVAINDAMMQLQKRLMCWHDIYISRS